LAGIACTEPLEPDDTWRDVAWLVCLPSQARTAAASQVARRRAAATGLPRPSASPEPDVERNVAMLVCGHTDDPGERKPQLRFEL
jgi:hypothetical protein